MKKFLLMPLVAALMASCSNSATKQEAEEAPIDTSELIAVEEVYSVESEEVPIEEQAEESVSEEEEKEEGYSAPFEFTFSAPADLEGKIERFNATIKLLKNGRMEGHMTFEKISFDNKKWLFDTEFDITGKWSTTHVSRGEGYQKVYVIDRSDIESSYYMPDDCEYIWYGPDSYYNCDNFTLQNVGKITEVKKL